MYGTRHTHTHTPRSVCLSVCLSVCRYLVITDSIIHLSLSHMYSSYQSHSLSSCPSPLLSGSTTSSPLQSGELGNTSTQLTHSTAVAVPSSGPNPIPTALALSVWGGVSASVCCVVTPQGPLVHAPPRLLMPGYGRVRQQGMHGDVVVVVVVVVVVGIGESEGGSAFCGLVGGGAIEV